jgi:hypothetical protein
MTEVTNNPQWVVGFNMPGYMPDSEPSEHETFEDALASLIWELEQAVDHLPPYDECTEEEKDEADELGEAIASLGAIATPRELGFTIGSYHYFLSKL